jgi:hypothetical protein
MKKFMKNLMKLLKKNTVSFVLSIILLVLIIYFIIDILKNNNIIENMTCEGEEGEEGEECEEGGEEQGGEEQGGEEQGGEEQGGEEQGGEENGGEENGGEEMSGTEELQEIVEDMEEEEMGAVVAMDMLSEMEGSILTNGEVVMDKPDTQSFRFNTPTPTPININVSYNNKNVVNDSNIDIDEASLGLTRSESSGNTMKSSTEEVSPNGNNNYGSISWNLTSDYYIPGVTNVNQNYNQEESSGDNNGYPYMFGRPWSNYMSGDHK